MGSSTTVNGLPPLPPGATANTPPATSGLPPLPSGATLATPEPKKGFGDWMEDLGKVMRPVPVPGVSGTMQANLTPPAIGGAKAAGSGMGGLLDFMHWLGMKYTGQGGSLTGYSPTESAFRSDYMKQHPGASEDEIGKAYQQTAQQKVNDHMQDASAWLRKGTEPHGLGENVGYFGELAGEMEVMPGLAAEDLLRIAGTRGAKLADTLANTNDLAKTLAKNPTAQKFMAIGIKAAKTAAEGAANMYGQTYLHTEDPNEAAQAAKIGAGVGAAAEVLPEAAQAWSNKYGTKTINIAGEEIPALARQVNEKGFAEPGRAEEAPKIQAAQEAAFPAVIGHTARSATRSALTELNQSRPIIPTVTDESRLLAAPEAEPPEPPQFTIQGTPIREVQEGALLQAARRKHIGTRVVERAEGPSPYGQPRPAAEGANVRDINPETGEGPELTGGQSITSPISGEVTMNAQAPSTNARRLVKEPVFQSLTGTRPGSPEPRHDVVGGGGTITTHSAWSVPEAEAWLHQYEAAQMDPDYDALPQQRRDEIESQRKSLEDQLNMHYASQQPPQGHPAYTQRFNPVDVDEAASHVNTFGDASAQIEAAAKPVYQRLDQLSDGEFTKLRQQASGAKRMMRRATTTESYENAERNYHEANNEIAGLIDRSSPHMTQEDYQAARNAWRQSRRLDELDTVFERMMNGVTYEEGEMGMPRYIEKARTKAIQNYLDTGTNQQQIGDLIGREGIINLKNVTNLLSERGTSQSAQKVMTETLGVLAKRFGHVGYGAAAGGLGAKLLGGDPYTASLAGGLTADALRWGWRYAATTPKVGQMIDMAVRSQVAPKIAAPLIARVLAQAAGLYQPGQEPEPGQEQPQK